MKMATPGETLDMTEPPSEASDRREVVILAGEAREVQKQKFLLIIRTDAGGFFGFDDSEIPEVDSFQGQFAELLPADPATSEVKLQACLLLQRIGITDDVLFRRQRGLWYAVCPGNFPVRRRSERQES